MTVAESSGRRIVATVTGMHRGGTTWFGAQLQASGAFDVLHEPFNYNHGLKGVPRWYLDPEREPDREFWDRSIADICTGRARYRRPFLPHAKVRSLAKFVLRTGAERNYREAMSSPARDIVLKDPFLLTFTPELARQGVRVILAVWHPGAIMGSLSRMGWTYDMEEFQRRGLIPQHRKFDGDAAMLGAYWAALFADARNAARGEGGGNVLFVSHERFFDDVVAGIERLARFLGLEQPPESMRAFVRRTTRGQDIRGRGRKVHQLERDSPYLAREWRERIDPDDLAILESEAGALFAEIYGQDSTE